MTDILPAPNAALHFVADLAERVASTFVEAFVPAFAIALGTPGTVIHLDTLEKAGIAGAVAGGAAVIAVLKGLIAKGHGNTSTASLLPAASDPAVVAEPTDAVVGTALASVQSVPPVVVNVYQGSDPKVTAGRGKV